MQNLSQPMASPRFSVDLTRDEMEKVMTAAYVGQLRNRATELDAITKERIRKVSNWLTNRKLKSGLILCGGVGNGKTTMLNAIHKAVKELKRIDQFDNRLWNLTIYSAEKVNEAAQMHNDAYSQVCTAPWLGIDDIGTESPLVKVYGTEKMPVANVILERYKSMKPIIITTNLTWDQLEKFYGERVTDRLKEMCEIIVYNTQSYRK